MKDVFRRLVVAELIVVSIAMIGVGLAVGQQGPPERPQGTPLAVALTEVETLKLEVEELKYEKTLAVTQGVSGQCNVLLGSSRSEVSAARKSVDKYVTELKTAHKLDAKVMFDDASRTFLKPPEAAPAVKFPDSPKLPKKD